LICVEDIDLDTLPIRQHPAGKRTVAHAHARSGRYVKALPFRPGQRFSGLAIDASVRAALVRCSRGSQKNDFKIKIEDLRRKRFASPGRTLVVFAVDASDSMGKGTFVRMKAAKGAVLALLAKARVRRYHAGMVAFNAKTARVVLPPTRSLALARKQLRQLPIGGATPLADGLMASWRMIKAERLKAPGISAVLVLISDGEANVPIGGGQDGLDVIEELGFICAKIFRDGIETILIDTKPRSAGAGEMRMLARWLGGAYHHIDRLKAGQVVDLVAATRG